MYRGWDEVVVAADLDSRCCLALLQSPFITFAFTRHVWHTWHKLRIESSKGEFGGPEI